MCYWNGFLDSPRAVSDSYLRVLQVTRRLTADCYLSVKAPALGFDAGLLKEVLYEAKRTNTTVHFDSMASDTVDRTFVLIDEARRIYPSVKLEKDACALMCSLRNSPRGTIERQGRDSMVSGTGRA